MTDDALRQLLALLSTGEEQAGELFVHLQGKLTRYFTWNLCANPEELADEVLDRVARRVAGGERVAHPVSYALGVARRVLLEAKPRIRMLPLDVDLGVEPREPGDARLDRLDACLERLAPESRALLLEFYSADAGERIRVRQRIADRLGLSGNALRNRCLRLRKSLEDCMSRRVARRKPGVER